MKTFHLLLLIIPLLFVVDASASETVVLQQEGKPLARYRFGAVPFKPYIDELRTPSGKNILDDAPADHVHHHGLMYAIRVGGCNFWEEANATFGKQVTVQIRHAGNVVTSEIDWDAPESKTLLKENREIGVKQENGITLLDWQSIFTAEIDTVLGDMGAGHYHGLGMRFDATMHKGGRFFSDTGNHDGEIVRGSERLTPRRWMAFAAKLQGEAVTVAMFDHPSNPVPMLLYTTGEATGSGVFSYMSATVDLYRKVIPLKAGQTFAVKYRVAVWDGEIPPEAVEKAYRDFVR